MAEANQPINVIVVENKRWSQEAAEVIVEAPVSLTVNGEVWLSFMCTPVNLEAMAVGFLFNEGIVQSKTQIADVRLCAAGDNVDVWLNHAAEKPDKWRRTSGCTGGVTAVEDLEARPILPPDFFAEAPAGNGDSAFAGIAPIGADGEHTLAVTHTVDNDPSFSATRTNTFTLTPNQVTDLIGKLFEAQDLYRRSGGVHTSALSDGQEILVTAEDIGRHNSLDKIAGRCLLEDIRPGRRVLLTTGRISSEMLQKSARLGASVIISRTSPSSLSIRLAQSWGLTLIGYARRTGFRIYAHPERILQPIEGGDAGAETPGAASAGQTGASAARAAAPSNPSTSVQAGPTASTANHS